MATKAEHSSWKATEHKLYMEGKYIENIGSKGNGFLDQCGTKILDFVAALLFISSFEIKPAFLAA